MALISSKFANWSRHGSGGDGLTVSSGVNRIDFTFRSGVFQGFPRVTRQGSPMLRSLEWNEAGGWFQISFFFRPKKCAHIYSDYMIGIRYTHTHTLDKNGSLYDPAGTESWNMQIRYETMKLLAGTSRWSAVISQALDRCLRWHLTYPCSRCPLRYLERERTEGRKREKFYICLDVTHTHPARAGSTLKGKRKKKADTRRADGQNKRRGGRGTDGPPEPTYTAKRTWPKQRTHLNPTTHYGEACGEN